MQKWIGGWHRYLPVQFLEEGLLHVENFRTSVRSIGDVDTVTYFGRVDLLVLACHQQGSDSHKLKLAAFYTDFAAIAIDDVDTEVECVGIQAEFHVDFDQPVDKDGTHFGVDIFLAIHVGMRSCSFLLKVSSFKRVNK